MSALKAGGSAVKNSMTGRTVSGAAKNLTSSGFLQETVAPGLKNAFTMAGGGTGLGRRVIGGAAIGGAASGTIGALRGNDFWESARGGALAGGAAGVGRHGYKMSQTGAGSKLASDVKGQYGSAKTAAARDQTNSDMSGKRGVGAESAVARRSRYQGQSFWDGMKADTSNAINKTKQAVPEGSGFSGKGKPNNMSKAVHSLTRTTNEQAATQKILNNNKR